MTLSVLYFKKVLQAGKISGQTHWETPTGPGRRGLPWNPRMFLAQGRGSVAAETQRPESPRAPGEGSPSVAGERGLRAGRARSPFRLL